MTATSAFWPLPEPDDRFDAAAENTYDFAEFADLNMGDIAAENPSVAVVIFPRERFSAAVKSLASVIAHTDSRYRLVIFDYQTPPKVLREMEDLVRDRPNVEWIRSNRFLNLNQVRNFATSRTTEDYVCYIENACLVGPRWIEAMVDACERLGAGIVSPRLEERSPWFRGPHHDRGFGDIVKESHGGRVTRRITTMREARDKRYCGAEPALVPTVESHCMMLSRAALNRLAPFDEALTAGTHVDICIAAAESGIKLAFAPASRVIHLPIVLARRYDLDLNRFRWDVARAAASRDAIARKWSLENMPDVGDFAWQQHFRTNPVSWAGIRIFAILRRILNPSRQ